MPRVFLFIFSLTFVLVSGTPNYCFENKCRCDGNKADCRYNDDKLKFIPKFPPEITSVDFSFNEVGGIYSANFFSNVTHITSLQMVSTGLTYIVPGAFDDMKNLQILDLSFNAFSRLSNETFSAETRRRLVQFDISQNRFDCDRDQLWLAEWQVSSPSVFENNIDQNYSCYDFAIHQHRDLLNFTCENFQVCKTCKPNSFLYIILAAILIVAIIFVLAGLTFRRLFSRQKEAKYSQLQFVDTESSSPSTKY